MITVTYSEKGASVSDFNLEKVLQEVMTSKDKDATDFYWYSTENIFHRIRLEIALGNLRCEDVTFRFGEKFIYPNRFGTITDWPDGFCDMVGNLAGKILRAAMNLRNKERNAKQISNRT